MSHLLNIRVYEEKDNQVIIGLSHFETNSRMVFACEFDASHDVDPWGVTPIEILGGAYSYFGQFSLLDKMKPHEAAFHQQNNYNLILDKFTRDNMSDVAVEKIAAFSSALSAFLNLAGTGSMDSNKPMPLESVKALIDDKIAILHPLGGKAPEDEVSVDGLVLSVTNVKQRDFTVHMAKLSPVFDTNVPRHYVDGNGADGVVESVLVHVKNAKEQH